MIDRIIDGNGETVLVQHMSGWEDPAILLEHTIGHAAEYGIAITCTNIVQLTPTFIEFLKQWDPAAFDRVAAMFRE